MASTTMKDLLLSVKTLLGTETSSGGTLYGIKQVKRGVLPPRNQYPMIILLPAGERYTRYYSGNKARVERSIEIHVVNKDLRGVQGFKNNEDYMDALTEKLRSNPTLPDSLAAPTTEIMVPGSENFNEVETPEGILLDSVTTVMYSSTESLPAPTIERDQVDDPSPKSIADAIHSRLRTLKLTTLSSVKEISRGDWGPHLQMPMIMVASASEASSLLEINGQDVMNGTYYVILRSEVLGASDQTLDNHLTMLEPLKQGLQATPQWSGMCRRSFIDNIGFSSELPDNKALYQTTIELVTESKRNI